MLKSSIVGVVILNWDGLELTKKCFNSLASQSFKDYKLVVIDNGSKDGSVKWLQAQPNIELILNIKNLGFAVGMNQGVNRVMAMGCKYVIALNNDTELDKNWIQGLVEYMEKHEDISFAQGANLQEGHKHLYDSTGIYLENGFIPNQRALGQANPRLDITAIGPNAAGAIYRIDMLRAIKQKNGDYFDSRFFAYVEDVDLDLRCILRGYHFTFTANAKLYHKGSVTGNQIAKKKMFWGTRNLIWLVYKNVPLSVLRKNIKIIVKSHLANLQFLWQKQRNNFPPYMMGLIAGLISSPRFYFDRRRNLRAQILSNQDLLNLLLPANPPLNNPIKKLINLIK